MKTNRYCQLFVGVVLLNLSVSCASALQSATIQGYEQTPPEQKEQTQQLPQQVEPQVRPTRIARELDPCELLALEESENFRAAGTAIARDESEAKSAAATDARNQLAQMLRVVVNGVSQDYAKNATDDLKLKTQTVGQDLMNQYVYQSLNSTKPILWSVYDLSDGNVQVYVCMELTEKPEDVTAEFETRMTQNIGANPINNPATIQQANINPDAEALYEKGRENCLKNDYDIGIPQLMKAVEMGSVNARYAVGLMYLYGDNVEKDSKTAFQYILNAANNGHKEAVFQVAEMYNSGTGVTKDKTQAKFWYRKSDELGDDRAESRLRRL